MTHIYIPSAAKAEAARRGLWRRAALYRWRRIHHRNPFVTWLLWFFLA